jgi:RimJ/RimL family protein N-acetyltransferase
MTEFFLETARLRLRPFALTDAPFIITLLNSPGWLRFIGDRHVGTEAEARTYLQNGPLASYAKHGFGLACVETHDNVPIGMCGLLWRDYLPNPDIGFAILPSHEGHGYISEIAEATLRHAAAALAAPVVSAIVLPDNVRSVKLLTKLGFVFERNWPQPETGEKLLVYRFMAA